MQDSLRDSLFTSIGQTLRFIHDHKRKSRVTVSYHRDLIKISLQRIKLLHSRLLSYGIDPYVLASYVVNAYEPDEVKISGITVVHGDFWLDNIIGRIYNNSFRIAGVIDWETSGQASPFIDFAGVYLSIENVHPESSYCFWKGYGFVPKKSTKEYFAIRQIIERLSGDKDANLESTFYKPKIQLIKSVI